MIVVDASIAVALVLFDEDSPSNLSGEDFVGSLAPTLWPYEVLSALSAAERRGRIESEELETAAGALSKLPIEFVHPSYHQVLEVSRTTGLSVYDASYLALAVAYEVPIATLDRKLRSAAALLGVTIRA